MALIAVIDAQIKSPKPSPASKTVNGVARKKAAKTQKSGAAAKV
jgi:hypothetical protein